MLGVPVLGFAPKAWISVFKTHAHQEVVMSYVISGVIGVFAGIAVAALHLDLWSYVFGYFVGSFAAIAIMAIKP